MFIIEPFSEKSEAVLGTPSVSVMELVICEVAAEEGFTTPVFGSTEVLDSVPANLSASTCSSRSMLSKTPVRSSPLLSDLPSEIAYSAKSS